MTVLEPYIDGYIEPGVGNELTVIPRVKFPFKPWDTYSRLYERDYEINPRSMPRIDQRTAWTNLLTYSQDTQNAAWTKTNLTVTANNIIAPDGATTMDKLVETVTNAEHSITQAATVTAAVHEFSIFAKAGLTRSWIRLAFIDSAAVTRSAFFNVSSGYFISATSGVTAKITNLGNGHFYCVIRFTPAAGAGTFKVNVSTDGTTISYAGSTSNGVYLWGAQVSAGTYAPYASTTSATRTILAPDRDPRDPLAFLLLETDPTPINSHRAIVTRTFGRIPRTQVVTRSRSIPKPRISGEFPRTINGVYVQQPDPDVDEYTFASQVAVTADSGPPAFGLSGGDLDITIGSDTASSIAYNASAGTYETALNALSYVSAIGTLDVTGAGSAFSILFTSYEQPTLDDSSMTNVGAGTLTNTASLYSSAGLIADFYLLGATAYNGGTFTLEFFGQTTGAIPWNCTAQDIQDELAGLSIIGSLNPQVTLPASGMSYTGKPLLSGNLEMRFRVTMDFPTGTADGSGLTPSGSATMSRIYQDGWALTLSSASPGTRTITAPGHLIATGDDIVVTSSGSVLPLSSSQYTLVNANQISLTNSAGAAFFGGSITYIGKGDGSRYAADSPLIAINLTTSFYLPGVSPGIDEEADIPIPSRGTPSQLLGAIFGGSTLFNYDVGEFETWLGETPITSITLTTLNPQLLISPDTDA